MWVGSYKTEGLFAQEDSDMTGGNRFNWRKKTQTGLDQMLERNSFL